MRNVSETETVIELEQNMRLSGLPAFLLMFVRDPVSGMRAAPPMSWPALFSLQLGAAMMTGALLSVIDGNFIEFLLGLFVFPPAIVLISFAFSTFLFYFFSVIQSRSLPFRHLHTVVTLATMPYFLLHIGSYWLPPIDLIGFALTGLLLIVGLVEHFGTEKKTAMRLISALFAVFLFLWIGNQIRMNGNIKDLGRITQPKSLDDLERDVRKRDPSNP